MAVTNCNRDVGRSGICALEHGHPPPCYAASALARDLLDRPARVCKFCHRTIRDGHTNTGRRSVFDLAPPHPNHWITCRQAEVARRAYQR